MIAHDTRHHSADFARPCAGARSRRIQSLLLVKEPRVHPSALVAVRHLGCDAGHDHRIAQPAIGQWLQVLWTQVAAGCSAGRSWHHRVRQSGLRSRDSRDVALTLPLASGSVVPAIPDELDNAYITAVVSESVGHARDVSIVYTPLHGVGETSVAARSRRPAFRDSYPRLAAHPRPATSRTSRTRCEPGDPRSRAQSRRPAARSRPGTCQRPRRRPHWGRIPKGRDPRGDWTTLDGNQIGVLLAAFVMKETEALGKLLPDHYLITTLVSTQMTLLWPIARGFVSRRICWWASSGSASESTKPDRTDSCSVSRNRTAT